MSEYLENALSSDDLAKVVDAVANGVPLADAAGLDRKAVESLYGLGYNLYGAGDYENAETIFQALCLYNHQDARFWQGLGGARQALGKYQLAVDSYSYGMLASSLSDPEPIFYSGICFLKMGDMESAAAAFESLEVLVDPAKPEQAAFGKKAADLLGIIRSRKEGAA